jgi:DNA-binding NarL/FixJ family response regulator
MKRTVFIVDDHPLVREWLTTLIDNQADLTVCGEAATAAEAMQALAASKPRVAIVDLSLRDSSGIDFIKNLRISSPETAVIVLSMHEEAHYVQKALSAGARGYIIKRDATAKVLAAVRSVLEGKSCFSNGVSTVIAEKVAEGWPVVDSLIGTLSERELEVFRLLGHCYSTRRIAQEMRVGFKTVQTFCSRIKEKLKLSTGTELLREALRWHDGRNQDGHLENNGKIGSEAVPKRLALRIHVVDGGGL